MPPSRRFRSNLVLGHQFLAPESVAGGCDGDALFKRIKVSFLFEFFPEFPTTCFEEFDV